MKIKIKAFLGVVLLSLIVVQANAQFAGIVSLSASAEMTATSTNNGTVTTTLNPVRFRINTKDLLSSLALDEFAMGNYASTNFPPGSHLVILGDIPAGNHIDFEVQDRNGGGLVNVSDIIKLDYGTNTVCWGKTNNSTGLDAPSRTRRLIQMFSYDSPTNSGSDLHFYLQGMATCKVTDSRLNRDNDYLETQSDELVGTGDGTFQGQPIVLTGDLNIIESHGGHYFPPGSDVGGDSGTITITIRNPALTNPPVLFPPPQLTNSP